MLGPWGTSVRSGKNNVNEVPDRARAPRAHPREKDMGDALRSIYHDAVEEDVPNELLDLLKKLD